MVDGTRTIMRLNKVHPVANRIRIHGAHLGARQRVETSQTINTLVRVNGMPTEVIPVVLITKMVTITIPVSHSNSVPPTIMAVGLEARTLIETHQISGRVRGRATTVKVIILLNKALVTTLTVANRNRNDRLVVIQTLTARAIAQRRLPQDHPPLVRDNTAAVSLNLMTVTLDQQSLELAKRLANHVSVV